MSRQEEEAKQGLTKKTLAGLKWSYLGVIVQAILQLTIISTLAHLLSPKEFGLVGIATIFTMFVERVGFLGLGPAVVQREDLSEKHIRVAFSFCIILGMMLFGLFFWTAPYIAAYFSEPSLIDVLRVISMTFLIASISEISRALLERELRFKELLVINNTSYLLGNGLLGISLALSGFGVWSLVWAVVATRLVKLGMLFFLRPQRFSLKLFSVETMELFQTGIGFSLGRLTNYVALVGDNFVVGRFLSADALGIYGRAYQLLTLPATYFGQVFEKVLFPAMAKRQGKTEQLSVYFCYGVEASSFVGFMVGVFLYIASPEIVMVLFGSQWGEVIPVLRILAVGVFFRLCYKNSDTVIRALGAVYRLALRQTVYAGLIVGGTLVGRFWGLEGVAIAVLLALMANYTLLSRLSLSLLGLSWKKYLQAHRGAVWTAAWLFLVLQPLLSLLRNAGIDDFFRLVAAIAAAGLTVLASLYYMPSWCNPQLFPWLTEHLEFERYGRLGRLGKQFLQRKS